MSAHLLKGQGEADGGHVHGLLEEDRVSLGPEEVRDTTGPRVTQQRPRNSS